MEIRSLSYFVAVARQLSFSRAAESLYVSQSSLSKNIAALEKELGVSLFVRKGRGISLTPAGKALLEGAQSLLEQEESLAQSVRHMANASAGGRLVLQLRQPVPSCKSFCRALISCAQDFREEHAPLELEFRYDDSPTPISSLPSARDNVDIYFSMANEVKMDPALDIESLMEMPFYLFAADLILPEGEKPHLPEILGQYPLLFLEDEGNAVLDVGDVLQQLELRPTILYKKGATALLTDLLLGKGVSIMPEELSPEFQIHGIRKAPLPDGLPHISIYSLCRRSNKNPLPALFLDELREALK